MSSIIKSPGMVVLAALLTLGLCSCDVPTDIPEPSLSISPPDTTPTPTHEQATAPADAPGEKDYLIGDVVELEDIQLQAIDVKRSSGNDLDTPKQGNEYVIAEVILKNTGDEIKAYNPSQFVMRNSLGQTVQKGFITVDGSTALGVGELEPGGAVRGTVPFEQPIGDKDLVLIYEGSEGGDDSTAAIDLMHERPEFELLTAEPIQTDDIQSFGIGETGALDDMTVQVIDVYKSEGTDFEMPREGHEYVIVEVRLENTGAGAAAYSSADFKVRNSLGQVTGIVHIHTDADNIISIGELESGCSVTGTLVFEQPGGDTGLLLYYVNGSLFTEEKIAFELCADVKTE